MEVEMEVVEVGWRGWQRLSFHLCNEGNLHFNSQSVRCFYKSLKLPEKEQLQLYSFLWRNGGSGGLNENGQPQTLILKCLFHNGSTVWEWTRKELLDC